ncbi:MAG: hypothetical protein F4Y92_04515 [Dehalococcoidia bacterium]|nr:hypothetical protein [Dehalococcoidia bacterium]
MASQQTARLGSGGRRMPGGRGWALYLAFAALVAAPFLVFTLGGVEVDPRKTLEGAGGPFIAFSAGVLSFLSPCVLPIVPIYITNLAGATVEGGEVRANRGKTFTHALAFVIGLSIVFIALGASAGLFGFALLDYQPEMETAAGVLLIVLGSLLIPAFGRKPPLVAAIALAVVAAAFYGIVEFAELRDQPWRMGLLGAAGLVAWAKYSGYIQFNLLQRTFKADFGGSRSVSYTRSAMVGGGFAVGWSPCVGPVLGFILTLAATSGDAATGTYLLAFYSAGLGIPFLLAGLAVGDAAKAVRKMQRFMPAVEVASAAMLIALGALLLAGTVTNLNEYFDIGITEINEGL